MFYEDVALLPSTNLMVILSLVAGYKSQVYVIISVSSSLSPSLVEIQGWEMYKSEETQREGPVKSSLYT